MLVGVRKVVIGNPEGQVVAGTVDIVKAVCRAVRSLIGAVEPFDHLFVWSVFCRDSVVVGKSDDLGDLEGKGFSELFSEFHGGVHDEPDVGFDAADFDVGFIRGEDFSFFVGILIHKGLDADGGSLAVVGDLLVGDRDVVEIFQGL